MNTHVCPFYTSIPTLNEVFFGKFSPTSYIRLQILHLRFLVLGRFQSCCSLVYSLCIYVSCGSRGVQQVQMHPSGFSLKKGVQDFKKLWLWLPTSTYLHLPTSAYINKEVLRIDLCNVEVYLQLERTPLDHNFYFLIYSLCKRANICEDPFS